MSGHASNPAGAKKGSWQATPSAPSSACHVSVRGTAEQHNGGGVTRAVGRSFGRKIVAMDIVAM
ncbi:hypothetical protein [Streptomyces sp. KHY 26]|uniref:hypothetical protein n=1 Tax=Streptomyces sp. KHY 26 TaxID=3097359 RepID=UPI00376EF6F8